MLWAADGKQTAEWGRTASILAKIHAITDGPVDPERFMPERYRADKPVSPEKSEKQLEVESEIAWKVIEHWIKGGAS